MGLTEAFVVFARVGVGLGSRETVTSFVVVCMLACELLFTEYGWQGSCPQIGCASQSRKCRQREKIVVSEELVVVERQESKYFRGGGVAASEPETDRQKM